MNDWGGLFPGQTVRIGRHLVDFGDEEWSADPEDSILITNSVSSVAGYDGGLNFRGSLPVTSAHPLLYSFEVLNGTGNDTAAQPPLTAVAKFSGSPISNLYVSASGLTTGTITGATGRCRSPP